MDRLELRKWSILEHMSDEQFDDIEFIHVYGSDRCSSEGTCLSALMISKQNQDVYGTGFNSMVGSVNSLYKMKSDEGEDLEENVKIEELCGIGLKKIVIGFRFGAGLTSNNELYMWGQGPDIVINEAPSVYFEVYSSDSSCSKCGEKYSKTKIGGFLLNKCDKCNFLPSYCRSPPPTGIMLRRFVIGYRFLVSCLSCQLLCQSLQVGGYDLNYCLKCDLLRPVSFYDVPSKYAHAPRKIKLPEQVKILDIDCGRTFLVIRTCDNRLFVWGSFGGSYYRCCVQNPHDALIRSISCGGNHVAVLTYPGDVYTFGSGDLGQLGYRWSEPEGHMTLRKVSLPGNVVKVCCRSSGTVCLLNDRSVFTWGSHMKSIGRIPTMTMTLSDKITTPTKIPGEFTDIATSPLTNVFCVRTEPLVFTWGKHSPFTPQYRHPHVQHKQVVKISASQCLGALIDHPVTYSSSTYKGPFIFIRHFIPKCPIHSNFFGNALFSDLSFKLSDGELPAHTLVLNTNSTYFKKLFETGEIPKTIDVSSFNPVAYRNLLKCLYGVQVKEEKIEDLFDLYAIAMSYDEKGIIDDTFTRLREALDPRKVLQIHVKAKSAGFQDVVEECEDFMDSPEYKNMLVKWITQDSQKSMKALAMIMDGSAEGD